MALLYCSFLPVSCVTYMIFISHSLHSHALEPSSPSPEITTSMMRVPGGDDDVVQIQPGTKPGDPFIITVNCPDKTGLACDICRIILDFGLCITKGDVSTDGVWCYIVLWVIPHSVLLPMKILKDRLQAICPPCLASFYLIQQTTRSSPVYLLKFCCLDRKGLLHDVTKVLSELELAIQKVKVTTTPDGRVLDLFFITDNMDLLHTRNRQDDTCERLRAVLRDSCISCELCLAGPEYEHNQGISSLSPVLAEELFRCELSDNEVRSQALSPDMTKLKKTNVILDNSLSPAHTLLQIRCADHKGLLYDIMRTLKDMNLKAEVGRHSASEREWEVYRFLLDENCEFQLTGVAARNQIVDRVRRTLMGWRLWFRVRRRAAK